MSQSPPKRGRRRKPSPVRKLRPFWFLVVLLLALGSVGAYMLLSWTALYPHTIEVSGNHVVPNAEIVDSAQIKLTQNMWLQNTHAMVRRIEAIPYIETALVMRRPPDTVRIVVTERAPYAVLRASNGTVTIDKHLRVLALGATSGELPAIVVSAPDAAPPGKTVDADAVQALARILDRAQDRNLSVEGLAYDRFGDVTMTLRSGVNVMLGDATSLGQRLALIEPILTQVQQGGRRIAAIDLRAITTPVVVYAK